MMLSSTEESLVAIGVCLVAPALLSGLPYGILEYRGRKHWGTVPQLPVQVQSGDGPYRITTTNVFNYESRSPLLVRVCAVSCFIFGQMFIPGLLLGLIGLLVMGVGIVSVPGLVTAALIWRTGPKLLRRAPDAVPALKSAATWAFWVNAVTALVSLAFLAAMPSDQSVITIAGGTLVYVCLSVAQAILMRATAKYYAAAFAVMPAPGAAARLETRKRILLDAPAIDVEPAYAPAFPELGELSPIRAGAGEPPHRSMGY